MTHKRKRTIKMVRHALPSSIAVAMVLALLLSGHLPAAYGYNADADRVSYEFLSTVAENFRRDGIIKEKYNVVTRSSEAHVELGYEMNVVGFGWTNAAFLELLHGLPKEMVERLDKEQNQPLAGK